MLLLGAKRPEQASDREGGMGIVETWVRDKPIRNFLARAAARRSAAAAPAASFLSLSSSAGSVGSGGDMPQLSSIANSVVSRCARILALSVENLQQNFETDFPDHAKESGTYAKEFLEYCCHKALHEVTTRPDYLADKGFRRLMYDMMLAWESPRADDESLANGTTLHNLPEDEDEVSIFYTNSTRLAVQVDDKKTVGLGAFTQIAPSCPIIADLITVHNLFDALTVSSGGRLHFLIYDKYLKSLDKVLKSVKTTMQSPLASSLHLADGECILAVDGDRPIQPVLQHIGISAWPGRLILTTHALYFQPTRVGYRNNKIVKYDLATDEEQVVKRDFTGPLGVHLFDKAVVYKSSSLTEPIYFDFPELGGPSRRDYWLAITREVLQVNRFIRKFNLEDIQRGEALSKAILGILRCCAIKEAFHIVPSHLKTTLTFNLAEKLPKGDLILETLYNNYLQLLDTSLSHFSTESMDGERTQRHSVPFSLYALSRMGFVLLKSKDKIEREISFCVVCFGVTKYLETALEESFCYSERTEAARATVDQVKVEGVDANLALMQELLFPFIEVGRLIYSLSKWEDPAMSSLFLILISYVIERGLIGYIMPLMLLVFAALMLWHKYFGEGKSLEALEVRPPPSKNAVEQILTLQEGISKLEDSLQAGNIVLLKFRAVLFAAVPKATDTVAVFLIAAAAIFALVPYRHLLLVVVLEAYTRKMPLRKQNTEKCRRRVREWWAGIPAAPVQMIKSNESKKRR